MAKHRNGPTATVTVAFQGHYSRFVDMAAHQDIRRAGSSAVVAADSGRQTQVTGLGRPSCR